MGETHRGAEGADFPYQYKYEHMAVTTDCVIFKLISEIYDLI